MLNMRRTILAFAVFATAAVPLNAQVYITRSYSPRGWLGITFEGVRQPANAPRSNVVIITSVSEGSPAERAGVLSGDTLVRLNDFRATTDLLGTMGASVEPGDTVRMVVRRDGRDHTLAVEVAKRPAQTMLPTRVDGVSMYKFDPDSVRGMVRIFVDSMYAGLDSTRMRVFKIDTMGRPGEVFMRDNFAYRSGMMLDSLHGRMPLMIDSLRRIMPLMNDSLMKYMPMMTDSLMKYMPLVNDSLAKYMPMMNDFAKFFADSGMIMMPSIADSMIRVLPRYNLSFEASIDTAVVGMSAPSMVFGSIARSQNAFGGAELAEMNADLGEYFGAEKGVLVLRVPESTPAARAGLEPGDIVTKVNGESVGTTTQFRRAAERARRGAPIKLEIIRHKKSYSIELKRD